MNVPRAGTSTAIAYTLPASVNRPATATTKTAMAARPFIWIFLRDNVFDLLSPIRWTWSKGSSVGGSGGIRKNTNLCHAIGNVALRTSDLRGMLAFVGDAHDADGPEALTFELLGRLTELVGCQYATYE